MLDFIDFLNADGIEQLNNGNYQLIINKHLSSFNLNEKTFLNDVLSLNNKDSLELAIASLLAFIQEGWTGPALDFNPTSSFNPPVPDSVWLKLLSVDGEECYPLTTAPILLVISKTILMDNVARFPESNSLLWWTYRCAFTVQKILDNPSGSLQDLIVKQLELIAVTLPTINENRELNAKFNLEFGIVHHFYGNDSKAYHYMKQAQSSTGLEWNLTGVMGRRTKFQTYDTSQLVLHAQSKLSIEKSDGVVPEKLDLNDEILLEKIEYAKIEGKPYSINFEGEKVDLEKLQGNLNVIDQTILLAFCLNVKNTNPVDGLTTEEMFPYVTRVLENPNNWMVTTMGLVLRSRLEANKSRTVERSCLQLQALVDQWRLQPDDSPVQVRMEHIFSLLVPSKWDMERELGERFVSIGVIRSALEIFERLHMWEQAISCHQMLEQPKKAEQLILSQLEVNPTSPKLLCLLGDVRGDISLYEKSWEISNKRFARAMRSLGGYWYSQSNWSKCIECYENALSINPLFENSWFIMGCAAMQIENDDIAIKAFSRCTQMDHSNAEAWNNLASTFIKQKKLQEAYRALKEATKGNYESSKIWDNYLYVAVDLGEFSEAIRAMDRVFSIRIEKEGTKNTLVDEQVLDIIIAAVASDVEDADGRPASRLVKKLEQLLNLITSKYASYEVFILSAKFYKSQSDFISWLEYVEKAQRHVLHDPLILEQQKNFNLLVQATLELATVYIESQTLTQVPRMGTEALPICKDWNYKARMAVKAVIGKTKSIYEGTTEYERLVEKLQELIQLKNQ
ncbi:hypothetical protein BC833DRAFT_622049 [Globomyces pollinis-pini]|nr:hypothetical protein BC833DRAFT_622049 [Globomyces pollinis-pini]